MSAKDPILAELARLPDDTYFEQPESVMISLPKAAMSHGFGGLALGAPAQISVVARAQLPALLLVAETAARTYEIPLPDNAVAVASDIGRGSVIVRPAFRNDPSKAPGPAPKIPSADDAGKDSVVIPPGAGGSAGTAWLDFRALLGLRWRESQLAIRVIAFDEVSNPVLVQLSGEGSASESFSRGEALEIAANAQFAPTGETPSLDSNGVVLSLDANEAAAGTGPLRVHGALRLPLSKQSIVPPLQWADWFRLPAAIVKATLLITIKNRTATARMDIAVPIRSDRELQPGEVVDATFSLDLSKDLPVKLSPGSYCIYLIAGEYLSGPHRLNLKQQA